MVDLRMDWIGLVEVMARVEQAKADIKAAMLKTRTDAASDMVRTMQTYPPVPPGSRYQRTLRIKGGWRVGIYGDRVQVEYTGPDYEEYVEGAKQTWFHARNGWPVFDKVAQERAKTMDKELEGAVVPIVQGAFQGGA